MKQLRFLAMAAIALLAAVSCAHKKAAQSPDPAFAQYIKAYTAGIISQHSGIRVELASDIPDELRVQEGLFSFSPAIKGTTLWNGPSSVEFIPEDGALKVGTRYNATFHLGKVAKVADKEMKHFKFGFMVQQELPAAAVPDEDAPELDGGSGFRVLSCTDKGDRLDVLFSEPLSDNATLKGLVTAEGAMRSYTKVDGDHLLVYYADVPGDITLVIDPAVKSAAGTALGREFRKFIGKTQLPPAVEIPVQGSILPDKGRLVLPLRSVNLSAVDVSVIQIFEQNVLMFLQSNELSGSDELRRSGRLVYSARVALDDVPGRDLHQWNNFALDLGGLIRREEGAIYRVRVSFKPGYSLYGREQTLSSSGVSLSDGTPSAEQEAVWDEPSPYYWESWYDWNNYNYEDRDNPEKPSYYMVSSRFPAINVMSSDIGLLAKYSGGQKLWVTVSDLNTAKPLSGATVEVYDFQLRKLSTERTGSDGNLVIHTDRRPFVVCARSGRSATYLKVNDGNQLSLSRFETGGKNVQDGIKAYIYGERGVWRPGDTLHVSMILSDRGKNLPEGHPVTMELFSPEGQFHSRLVRSGTDGFYCFDVPTLQNDPTGSWNAYFKVGGSTFHKSLNIETVKPNRLKVGVDFGKGPLQAGWSGSVSVSSSWLTGSPAASLKARSKLILRSGKTQFKGFESYNFDAPLSPYNTSEHELYCVILGADGKATPTVSFPKAEDAAGMLRATIVSTVTEKGGDESFVSETFDYSPFTSYVGIKLPQGEFLETDKTQTLQIVTLDSAGQRSAGRSLSWSLYRIQWSWWWENRGGSLDSYVGSSGSTVYAEGKVKTGADGEATVSFKVPSDDWGRYILVVRDTRSGHRSGASMLIDWPDYAGRADRRDPQMLSMLTFSTDKKSYEAGQTATVYIPAARGGRALVSIEKAGEVLSRNWVTLSADAETAYRIPVTADMAPNFYIHITLLQPYGNTANDLPLRMYGVQRVMVSNPLSVLEPQIEIPSSVKPEQEFSVKVREKSGRTMTYTLALVDEGLLDITAFKTPNAWREMYATEALGIDTWDMFDEVIGAASGRMSVTAAIGGDEDNIVSARKDNRFNPVVRFIGPVTVQGGKTSTHKITLPMYVGSLRAMVVAAHDGAYGSAQQTVTVKSPLMILPSQPRTLSVGETMILPINVFAMDDKVQDVSLSAEVSGPVAIEGYPSVQLHFASAGDQIARLNLRPTGEGTAVIKLKAVSGSDRVSEEVRIPVRVPGLETVSVKQQVIAAGESASLDADQSASLTLCTAPAVNEHAVALRMINYSYDCSEQLSSRGLALLHLMPRLESELAERARSAVQSIVTQLYARQRSSGGFAYWSGSKTTDTWVSSMAGQFLCEASAAGFTVDSGVIAAWKKYQRSICSAYRHGGAEFLSELDQSYRLYTLAVAGNPDTGAMNRLKESSALDGRARWTLASAYALCGNKKAAQDLLSTASGNFEEYSPYNITYGSSLRDKALALEAYALCADLAQAMPLAQETAAQVNGGLVSTAETAFAVIALDRIAQALGDGAINATIRRDGGTEQLTKAAGSLVKELSGPFTLTNNGTGKLFATLVSSHAPLAGEAVPARQNGLSLSIAYADASGAAISPASIAQGTEFSAVITVGNLNSARELKHLALTYLLPTGWEVVNERLLLGGDAEWDNVDIRDDRVMWYFELGAGASARFNLKLRAAWEGSYLLPAATCEAMYEPAISANTASSTTAVTR